MAGHEALVLRHVEDGAPLSILINDAGALLVVCKTCQRLWTGHLEAGPWPDAAADDGHRRQSEFDLVAMAAMIAE